MNRKLLKPLKYLLIMVMLTGLIYPLFITGVSQIIFPFRSNGSLLKKNGKIIGSELIGQKFDSSIYFWSRPSSTDYNPVPSGASNYGPTSEKLKQIVMQRKIEFCEKNGISDSTIVPLEMLFASGSGLDPHISPESAKIQAERVARVRNFNPGQRKKLMECIDNLTEHRGISIFGEKRVNVLLLNIETDSIK